MVPGFYYSPQGNVRRVIHTRTGRGNRGSRGIPRLRQGILRAIQSFGSFPYKESGVFGVPVVDPELVWEVDGDSVGDEDN